jgi:4-hydroxybenzoate polyprenyltransferase
MNQPVSRTAIARAPRSLPSDLIRSTRPRQWIKNGFVFGALIFASKLAHPDLVMRAVAAFALFCTLSGAIYLLNDVSDREADRRHPLKAMRPIASGRVSVTAAVVSAGILLVGGVGLSFLLNFRFGLIALGYVVLMALYTGYLKHLVLIDVFAIGGGFVLRAAGGAAAISVSISPWLYLCTILLSLFLGFGKRRHELLLLEGGAGVHRKNLDEYTAPLLDNFITIVAGATIIAYSMYTFFASAVPRNHAMMITIPFVLYGVFRYLLIVHRTDVAGAPEEAVWRDGPLLVDLVLWAIASSVILHLYR